MDGQIGLFPSRKDIPPLKYKHRIMFAEDDCNLALYYVAMARENPEKAQEYLVKIEETLVELHETLTEPKEPD